LVAAVTHGFAIGLYALLCISGIAVVITTSTVLFKAMQWAGAAYLVWMGANGLRARTGEDRPLDDPPTTGSAARDGFVIAFLNPKVAIFFIALFSQVIGNDTSWLERLAYAATALVIDMAWYVVVAWLFSNPRWLGRLQANVVWLERLFGLILIALALRLFVGGLVD
jgi:threonine/homoserine/homoserine lactone efflux protein